MITTQERKELLCLMLKQCIYLMEDEKEKMDNLRVEAKTLAREPYGWELQEASNAPELKNLFHEIRRQSIRLFPKG